jgi:ribosome-binding factor A
MFQFHKQLYKLSGKFDKAWYFQRINSNKNTKFAPLMESNRQRKVAQIIQEDFAELFRKQAAESKQSILVSVSDVKVTPDLGIAKIYLSIFPKEFRSAVMKEIEENKAQYRNFLGQKMAKQVRVIPNLNFYLDTALDDVEKLERELRGEGDNPIL